MRSEWQPAGNPVLPEAVLKHWLGSVPTDEHAPEQSGWTAVAADDRQVTVTTACTCGHGDCGWTATASFRESLVFQAARPGVPA